MKLNFKKTALQVFAGLIIAVILGGFVVLEYFYGNTIYPNTFAANLDISLAELEDAAKQIDQEVIKFMEEPIVLLHQDQIFEFKKEDLGITFNPEETLKEIPLIGDLSGLVITALNMAGTNDVDIIFDIDEEKFQETLSILALEKSPQDAYISMNPETNEVEITPSQEGQEINTKELLTSIEHALQNFNAESTEIPFDYPQPTIEAEDLEPYLEPASQIFQQEIYIYRDDLEWIFSPKDHADFFTFQAKSTITVPGFEEMNLILEDNEELTVLLNNKFDVIINREKLTSYLEETIEPEVKVEPQDVKILMNDDGTIGFEGTGTDGESINQEVFAEMLDLALENAISEFDLPISIEKAGVESPEELQELGITELIATGYSSFYGSPYNRNHNIEVGLSKFNSLLVAPGETFSFIDNLGAVDGASGYYKELVIKENETIPEYGGGLCQVSSTMFRAILNGGLPIATRTEHSYAVSYYAYPDGYGLDATIYQPWPDLQFVNDTGAYILIQAYSEGTEAYFKFYGTSDGRKVIMDGPYYSNYVGAPADVITYTTELEPGETQKKDSAHTGFDVTWYRTVISPDGTEATETIASHYQAWPAKYLVGVEEEQGEAEAEPQE